MHRSEPHGKQMYYSHGSDTFMFLPFGKGSAAYTPIPSKLTEDGAKYNIDGMFLKDSWTSASFALSDLFNGLPGNGLRVVTL